MKAAKPAGVICSGVAISEPMARSLSGAGTAGEPGVDRLLQLRDDRGRRAGGRQNADIALRGEILDAALDEGGDIRRELGAVRRGDRR